MTMLVDSRVLPRADIARRRTLPPAAQRALVTGGDLLALLAGMGTAVGHGWRGTLFVALAMAALAGWGHHRIRIVPSLAQEVGPLLAHLGVVLVATSLLPAQPDEIVTFLRSGALAILLVVVARSCLYAAVRRLRASGRLVERTLILGAGAVGVEMANVLLDHPEYGLAPVGFLDCGEGESLPLPVLGGAGDLRQVLDDHDVRRVIVAFGPTPEPELVAALRACDKASVDIHVLPRFFELAAAPPCLERDDVWGLPLLRLRRSLLRRSARAAKRLLDVSVAGVLLLLTAPVCAVIHALVRLSSPGPVLFRQRRVGQHGQEIEVLKFRSLRLNDDSDTAWSASDDRKTPVGAVLRKTSLDELPQLLNVLRGEMSLVGPRPERPVFVERFSAEVPRYPDRHRAPAGMTGWAQVHGLRGDTSIEERARFDNQYIESWSLWSDIVILARTAREMVTGGERKVA